jgi:hypothetical protein
MAQRQWRSDDTSSWLLGYGDGSDGNLVISADTTDTPIESTLTSDSGESTGTVAASLGLVPGQLVFLCQKMGGFGSAIAGNWELNRVESYTGTTVTFTYPTINTYSTSGTTRFGYLMVLKQYNNVTVDATKTWTASSFNPTTGLGGIFGFFCKGTLTVNGIIELRGIGGTNTNLTGGGPNYSDGGQGRGFWGGRHAQQSGGTVQAETGYSSNGPGVFTSASNDAGGGGATATATSFWPGGGGGHADAGTAGTTSGGTGVVGAAGAAQGVAGLTTIFMGAGGGGGATAANGNGGSGAGGGAIGLFFAKDIVVDNSTGTIYANGGNGGGGGNNNGGGGGAGGSILFKCQTASLGTGRVTSTGGTASNNGGAGANGRIHVDYATSIAGTTSPTIDTRQDTTITELVATSNNNYSFFM